MDSSNFLNNPSSRYCIKSAYAVTAFALVGLGVSTFLATKHFSGAEIGGCLLFANGCDIVNNSKYSVFLGIPLAVYGMIYYFTLLTLAGIYIGYEKKFIFKLIALGGVIGFLLSIMFVAIQAFLIGAFCFYCEVSAASSTLILLVTLPILIQEIKKFRGTT